MAEPNVSTVFCNLLTQRRYNQINNIPPVRFTPLNPYVANAQGVSYTQAQLNMRRKTEILKYNKNSTQGPRQTKVERFALLTRGNYRASRLSCPTAKNIPVLSSAAGVPGPPIYLVEDPSVPLYNYNKDTNAYAEEVVDDTQGWSFMVEPNKLCQSNNATTTFATLNIREPISQPYTAFTLITPVIFKIVGSDVDKVPIGDGAGTPITATVLVTDLQFQPYYNDSPINNNIQLNTQFDTTSTSITITPGYTGTGAATTYDYSCDKYVGLLKIENIILSTEPGFVYQFKLNYNVTLTGGDILTRQRTTFGMYLNVNSTYDILEPVNCLPIDNTPSTSDKKVSFSGVSM